METLRGFVILIFCVSALYCCSWEIFRGIFVRKRVKEYADGLKTNIISSEELMQLVRNMNCFLVKQIYYNEEGNVEVHAKYGRHCLKLENGIIHVIRSKEDTKRNYNYVVEENAILDYIAKEENHGLQINPYTKYKKAIRLTKLHTASIFLTFGAMFLALVLYLTPSGNEYIEMVKNGTPNDSNEITYGEALDNFFSEPDWKYYKTSDGEKIVEFTGNCKYHGESAELCFQFHISDDNESFTIEHFEIDGKSKSIWSAGAALEAAFSDYRKDHGIESSSQNESDNDSIDDADKTDAADKMDATDETDYMKTYSTFVIETDGMYPESSTYLLYDINNDGRKDLLISYGTCNADYQNIIYTIDENGSVSSTQPFYGVYSFYEAEDGNGLYEVYGYMGYEEVKQLTLDGSQAEEELLWSRDVGEGEYYSNDNPVEYAECSDLSLLDE